MDHSAIDGGGPPGALARDNGQPAGTAGTAGPGRPTDGFAVAALITGVLPAAPLTLILGPVALSRIARTGARGRALAITGLVLAGVWILAAAATVAVLIALRPPPPQPALPQVFRLRTGECFNAAASGTKADQVVACSRLHGGEVFGTFRVAGHRYPGDAALQQKASSGCMSRLAGYLNPQLSSTTLAESYIYPGSAAWAAGERTVVCTVRSTAGRTTGSVRALPG